MTFPDWRSVTRRLEYFRSLPKKERLVRSVAIAVAVVTAFCLGFPNFHYAAALMVGACLHSRAKTM